MEDKKTALYDEHIKLKAKMVPFGGWCMPVQYEGIIKEHNATRNFAGLFDVSHMGEFFVCGEESLDFLQSVVPQDLSNLECAHAIYCQLPNSNGGLIDDLIIYNAKGIIENVDYMIVANASRIDVDFDFLQDKSLNFNTKIMNVSSKYSMLALQGKNAKYIIDKMGIDFGNQPKFFTFINTVLYNIPVFLTRTGYTGEDGFEIIFENQYASILWNKILSFKDKYNVVPVGLGARDTLRLEAGLPLYGHELDENTTPLESSLGFFIPKEKVSDYSGKDIISGQKLKTVPLRKKLIPFIMEDKQVARNGYPVYINNKEAGYVTSGAPSPTLGKNIGFCMINFENLDNNLVSKLNNTKESIGMDIEIMIRNKLCKAKIVKKPFIQKKYEK